MVVEPRKVNHKQSSRPGSKNNGNNNNSNNKNWYQKRRKEGIKVHRRGPKPPQWEKEGDELYQEIIHDNPYYRPQQQQGNSSTADTNTDADIVNADSKKMTYEQAQDLLQTLHHGSHDDDDDDEMANITSETKVSPPLSLSPEPPYLWGGLSVGPVWKDRLLRAGFTTPTPIQIKAFAAIAQTKKTTTPENFILASATGSGKSLAYLLPLLTTLGSRSSNAKIGGKSGGSTTNSKPGATANNLGRIWILTPTTELALQLQRVVSTLFLDKEKKEESTPRSDSNNRMLHVLSSAKPNIGNDDNSSAGSEKFPLLNTLMESNHPSPILAGTAKTFQQLVREIRDLRRARQSRSTPSPTTSYNDKAKDTAQMLSRNLQTIVLDEADRLLQTEAVARSAIAAAAATTNKTSKKKKSRPSTSTTRSKAAALDLLETILMSENNDHRQRSSPSSSSRFQSLSNQNQPCFFDSQKIQIICASATVGRTLRRQLMTTVGAVSMDKAATLIVADERRTKKDAKARKASLLPSTLQHDYHLVNDDDQHGKGGDNGDATELVLSTLVNTLSMPADDQQYEPASLLIFPGRNGVKQVQCELRARGFENVCGLEDTVNADFDSNSSSSTRHDCWKKTPIFVVGEKLGRGLDIANLKYVVLLQVPSSAAGYTHLAGRTGRNGNVGTVLTFCRPREAPKLMVIAETLGLSFRHTKTAHI